MRSWATEVRLRLPDADQKHLQHLAALHRREQTALLERRMEQDKRAYLNEDVFATPGSAAVWWLVNNPGEVETALGLLDTLSELSAAANDLPVRRSSADVIDRTKPVRAELDFNSAVDHLLEAGEPAPDSAEPSTRPVPRHADPQQPSEGPNPAPIDGIKSQQKDSPASQQNDGTEQPPSDRPGARPTDEQSDNGTIPPPADADTAPKSARNGITQPSGEQPEAKYREQFYSE